MIVHQLLVIVSLTLPALICSSKYYIIFDDYGLLKPCIDAPEKFITSWYDISNVTFGIGKDEEITIDGYFERIIELLPDETYFIDIDIYREMRGEYQFPMLHIKRRDMCKTFYDPNEIWFAFVNGIEGSERKCPPEKGMLRNWTSKRFLVTFPDPGLMGAYRLIISLGANDVEEKYFCFTVDLHLYKK